MSDVCKYVVENDCFYLVNDESQSKVKLSNFVARITHKIDRYDRNGLAKVTYRLKGELESGDELPEIEVSFEDYQKAHWPEKYWGPSIQVNTTRVTKSHQHLINAINTESKNVTIIKRLPHVGYIQEGERLSHFQFCNGALTEDGIDWYITSNLPNDLQQPYQLLDTVNTDEVRSAVKQAMAEVFEQAYVDDSVLLLLLACRSVLSYWLPITNWLLVCDPRDDVLEEYGQIFGGFFNPSPQNVIVNWPTVQQADQAYFKATRNVVSVIDCCNERFNQTENPIGIQNLIDCISSQLYGDIKSSKNAVESVVGRPEYNVLLAILSTDMIYLPKHLRDKVVYLEPHGFSRHKDWRRKLLALTETGVFSLVMTFFIQYILNNQDSVRAICFDGYKQKAGLLGDELKITWKVISNWLKNDRLFDDDQVSDYRKYVYKAIKVLSESQQKLAPRSLKTILFDGLKNALDKDIIRFNKKNVGEKIPDLIKKDLRISEIGSKDCIGWYDHKEKSIYIKDDQNLIISLISEHERHLFIKGPNKFWKQLAEEGCIVLSDGDRNSTRLKMPDYNKRVYRLNYTPEDFYN